MNELDQQVVSLAKSIRQVESGNNFNAKGASGEHGAYQFMPSTWKMWSKEVIGDENAPLTPSNQNAVAYVKIKEWKDQGLNPAQIAAKWNSGSETGWENKVGKNQFGVAYNVPEYVKKVTDTYQTFKSEIQEGLPKIASVPNAEPFKRDETYGALFKASPDDNPLEAGAKALGNVPSSLFSFGKAIGSAIINPIDTAKGLGKVALGGVQSFDKDTVNDNTETFDNFLLGLNDRYGTSFGDKKFTFNEFVSTLQKTATNDPFGFGTDIASLGMPIAKGLGVADDVTRAAQRTAQMVTRPVNRAGEAVSAPFGRSVNPDVVDALRTQGIDPSNVPASAISNSPFVKRMEAMFDGENLGQKTDDFGATINKIADDLIAKTGETEDIAIAGERLTQGVKEFEKAFNKTKEVLYDKFSKKGGNLAAKVDTTTDALLDIIRDKEAIGDSSNLSFFNKKLEVITGGEGYKLPDFDTLKKLRTDIGEKISGRFGDPFASQNIKQLRRLYGSLSDDMEATIKATGSKSLEEAFVKANDYYKEGVAKLQTNLAKRIARLAKSGQFDKIVSAVTGKSTSVNDIPAFLEVIGKENIPQLQSAVLGQIFDIGKNLDGVFTENGVARAIDKIGEDKLRLILDPEQLATVKDIETLSRAFQQAQKVSKGSQTAFLSKQIAGLGLGSSAFVALLTGNVGVFFSMLAPVLGDQIAGRFIASRLGQKVLTTGLEIGESNRMSALSGAAVNIAEKTTIPARVNELSKPN